ncbi:predicted protein [Naegleria gruberi]|uniref:Predicted protein n=1 Tax=Naegleria gruberi TaxID=5762 RepID=D2VEJ0_NAEGR|nr:uncharacterized protein NAEGRDRAFT_48906 [Naegleria gruberi]EFC44805.1 predicted protein [Naegleria gruberi]|eukprot:XP_002677549.1 predicted protein [Naegleria gruberi strain NEG-M]
MVFNTSSTNSSSNNNNTSEQNNSNSNFTNPTFNVNTNEKQESLFNALTNLNNQFLKLNTNPTLNLPINFPTVSSTLVSENPLNSSATENTHGVESISVNRFPRFKVTTCKDNNGLSGILLNYYSIISMPEYKERSFEEWRWLYTLSSQGKLTFDPFRNQEIGSRNGTIKSDSFKSWKFNETNTKPAFSSFSFFNNSTPQINAGVMTISSSHFHTFDMQFSDLDIDIYEGDKLFGSIDTHRVLVSNQSKVLSNMITTKCKKRNEKYVLELNTSMFGDRLGKISGALLYTSIKSIVTSVNVHIDDFLQVFLIVDYYQSITIGRLSNTMTAALKSSESVARSFIKSFGTSYFNISQSENIQTLFTLFREAFRTLMVGTELENEHIFKMMSKDMFLDGLIHSECKEITTLLKVIDCWASSNLNFSAQDSTSQVYTFLDVIPNAQPLVMIGILSSSPSVYSFINNLSSDWKLKLINKYVLVLNNNSSKISHDEK